MTDETIANFSISVKQLADPQNFSIQQLFHALETNPTSGILGDSNDLYRRRKSFGSNNNFSSSSSITQKSFHKLTLEAFKDTTIILLLCCAVLSLVIGIKSNGLQEGIFDVAIIFLPIFFVVNFSVTFRFFKARWISKKRMAHKNKVIRVLRHQQLQQIPTSELVVGDIVFLESGDEVPADGILIQGNSFKFDDGISNLPHERIHHVLFNRTKLVEGNCMCLVTAIGENTERIRLMKRVTCFQNDGHESKLHRSIDEMSSFLDKLCLSLSLIFLVVQVFRCLLWNKSWCCDKDRDPKGVKNTVEEIMNEATKYMRRKRGGNGTSKVNGLVAMLCILVFSLKDVLSLGIFIILLYSSKDFKKSHQIIVHKLPSCANGALFTTLCLSKTPEFVLNFTTLADLWIGFEKIKNMSAVSGGSKDIAEEVLNTLREGICMNIIGGGVDEDALLIWAEKVLVGNIEDLHGSCTIVNHENRNPCKGLCGVLLKRNKEDGEFLHVHWKGEPKLVLSMCSHYFDINGTMQTLDEGKRELFNGKIATDGIHGFGFAYKRVIRREEERENYPVDIEEYGTIIAKDGLSFLGIVVIKNSYSTELRRTIEVCRKSGIEIKLIVDDDLNTARLMALNSGILRVEEDLQGSIIEATEFRRCPKEAQISMCHKIKVMANSSPADKLLLVHCLRKWGGHVAATGTSIRDLPSLKEADVGIFVGENCADLAKDDADITVVDSNLGKIPTILILGRYICTNLEKFIQLQLVLNISAFTSNFVLLIYNPTSDQDQQLTTIQLLWINLIIEIFGALFLAIITSAIKPHESEVDQIVLNYSKPATNYGTGEPIVIENMLRNIAVQSMLQATLLLMLAMKGKSIFRIDEASLSTMIFNIYVLCQVFLLIISAIEITKTRISKENIIRRRKWLFMASCVIIGIMFALQVILVQIMSKIDHWKKLGIKQWSFCIGTAALSLPIHCAAKMISSTMQSFLILFKNVFMCLLVKIMYRNL
ncbi:calcium-transporting ATPase 12, plasma membrane-type-like [Lycium ferocissimum]|uniref:calcium-transporting ATPase 12, plasma membrane-type-like n=1 Tax=Lycium ferocissimum TaxID=112874 RepID=UPI0028152DAE|nr:calcium-transporting ATPase 12, plasma membrane-type-like [Lycium ferocissimum]